MCAEAAPDIFSAYASSIGADLGVAETEAKGSFNSAIAETAATIERTQTVNLLRESMYRTCERYLSGAINENQFTIQAARDQKSMVTVLAIEQLTGAIRPKATIIAGPATMASHFSGEEAAKLIRDNMKRRDDAEAVHAASKLALEKGKEAGVCDSASTEAEGAKDSKADPEKCLLLQTEEATAKAALKKAEDSLAEATNLASSLIRGGSASTRGIDPTTGGVGASEINGEMIKAVAQAVEKIATSPLIDESLMFCIGRLTSGTSKAAPSFYEVSDTSQRAELSINWYRVEQEIDASCVDIIRQETERKKIELQESQRASAS